MPFPTFTASTTAEEVADGLAKQIHGKNVLITGTSLNGIGFETARTIAKHANLVIITGYNSERCNLPPVRGYRFLRLKLSEETIRKDVPGANIRPVILDLSSLAAVRKAAEEVNAYPEPIHVLIHNAAHGGGPFQTTVDGFEIQMATAHIGPFLLTKLIAPKLLASDYIARVVVVSSIAHSAGTGVNLEAVMKPKPEKYFNRSAYEEAKSANVLFAAELSRRSGGKIKAYSLHPGGILSRSFRRLGDHAITAVFTNIMQKADNKTDLINMGVLTSEGRPNESAIPFKTIGQGAATTVVAAFDPRIDGEPSSIAWTFTIPPYHLAAQPGSYLVDCIVANEQVASHCKDPDTAKKLWTVTEQAVGVLSSTSPL